MLKEPSGLCSHPSKTATTFWPVSNRTCASPRIAPASAIDAANAQVRKARLLLLLLLRRRIVLFGALGDFGFEFLVGHVVVGQPVPRHVVGGAVAETDPVARIGIVPIARRIIVPADH